MCSTPKSNGRKPRQISKVSALAGLSTDARTSFTAIANAADERRQKRLAQKKARAALVANSSQSIAEARDDSKTKPQWLVVVQIWIDRIYHWLFEKDLFAR